jgi:hypothetical protein
VVHGLLLQPSSKQVCYILLPSDVQPTLFYALDSSGEPHTPPSGCHRARGLPMVPLHLAWLAGMGLQGNLGHL